ncbi:MAG: hypothetical protein ACOX6H_02945 [Christensenellales bacterium]|jgi:hypothetical protein
MQEKQKHWDEDELISLEGEVILPIEDGKGGLRNEWMAKDLYYKPGNEFSYKGSVEGEILYYFLAKTLGMEALEVKPALYVEYGENARFKNAYQKQILESGFVSGSVSKKFLKENEEFVEFIDLCGAYLQDVGSIKDAVKAIESYAGNLQEEKQIDVEIDLYEIKKKLTEIVLLDWFTKNRDRNASNLGIIVNYDDKRKAKIKLAPIYDNAMIFDFHKKESTELLTRCIKEKNIKHFERKMKEGTQMLFMSESVSILKMTYENCEAKLKNFILSSLYAKTFYEKIKTINFDEILKEIEKHNPNYTFPKDKLEIARLMFKLKIKNMEKSLAKGKENGEEFAK